jgi:hypothetical protein
VNDTCSNFGEFDGSHMNGLDQKLPIFRNLHGNIVSAVFRERMMAAIAPSRSRPPASSAVAF